MRASAERTLIEGAAGRIEIAASVLESPRAVAVVAHPHPLYGGTMDNKVVTTVARAFTDAGATTFRFNFRGVGATEGTHDEGRGETEDCLAVIAHARRAAGGLPLWIAGFSFGGAVAVKASAHEEFKQLVLVAPGFRRLTGQGLGTAPDPHDPELGQEGRHTAANTVIIHGDLDETVPLQDSIAWATHREVPVVLIPGAEHFFHRKLHLLREAVARWIT
ncbi:MAG TPA: alpha/beta fold hydrolase [Opitutaceae bacterium]|nr:alpha/beta fold hydrolase [Opitutaceae bacterium]